MISTRKALRALITVGALWTFGNEASAQEVTWRASGSFPAGHSTTIAMEIFASEVARLSDDTITVELFPDNVLGGAFEQVDQLRTGQIQMAWGGLSYYDKLVPEFGAATLPFAASSSQEAICQIDSEFGRFMQAKAEEKGIMLLGWGQIGARHVTNNLRPITSVEDMEGLKIRTPSGESWTLTFRALGANPTPIDIKELYQALQQGVVDGQENPYDNMLVRNFQEVQTYLSNTGHFFDWSGYLVHKGSFDELTPEQQEAVRDAMFTAIAAQRAISDRENSTARDALIEAGMEYHELSKEDLAEFREATIPVYDQLRQRLGDEIMDLAEAAIEKCQ